VDTTTTWGARLRRVAPVTPLAQELVRFDLQKMQSPDIEGVAYQCGTLAGYELGESPLQKRHRTCAWCAYCDAPGVPLQKDHILARSTNGSDRVGNLTLACRPCHQTKGALDVREFLAQQPERLKRILAVAKAPLRDAAAVLLLQPSTNQRKEAGSGSRCRVTRCASPPSRTGHPAQS
jgi:5-methylcytosine-specific restriction endonuclease McrA